MLRHFLRIALIGLGSAAAAQQSEPLACALCHHPTGAPSGADALAYAPYPQIAGLPARYIAQQLRAYRSGERSHALMGYVAGRLTDDEIDDYARAYAVTAPAQRLRRDAATAGPAAYEPAEALGEEGRRVAVHGVWERGVPPCQSCHAAEGQRPSLSPVLAGMDASYILGELRAYAAGARGGGPLGRMADYADRLTSAEMEAVADWYAALPAPMREDAR